MTERGNGRAEGRVLFAPGPPSRRGVYSPAETLAPVLAREPHRAIVYIDHDEDAPIDWPRGVEVIRASEVGGAIGRGLWAVGLARAIRKRRSSLSAVVLWDQPGAASARLIRLAAGRLPVVERVTRGPTGRRRNMAGSILAAPTDRVYHLVRARYPGLTTVNLPPAASRAGGDAEAAARRTGGADDAFHLVFDGPIDRGNVLAHLARIVPYLLLAERRVHFHFRVRPVGPLCRARAQDFYRKHLAVFCLQASLSFGAGPDRDLWGLAHAVFAPYEPHVGDGEIPPAALAAAKAGRPVFLVDRGPWPDLIPDALHNRVTAPKDPDLGLRILEFVRDPAVLPAPTLAAHGALFDPDALWRLIDGGPAAVSAPARPAAPTGMAAPEAADAPTRHIES